MEKQDTNSQPRYIAEPFKIKMVEPIKMTTKKQREAFIKAAHYNLFGLDAENIYIDLLTDSGTGAMSDAQWAGIMRGDESYAGARSYRHLVQSAQEVFGYHYIQPVHQGRAAEKVLFPILVSKGQYSISNMHFDTTRGHIEVAGGRVVDCVCKEALDTTNYYDFKGDFDLARLEGMIGEFGRENVGVIIATVTNNTAGGQPVSMANLRAASQIAKRNNIPFVIDAARFAENAYFIKEREAGYSDKSIASIALEMFSYASLFVMSAKKDAIVNMGGLIGVRDKKDAKLYEKIKASVIVNEGFITYGGLSGHDLEALAIGLKEGIEYDYLRYRVGQIEYLGGLLKEAGIPFQYPVGGHALFVDAKKLLPHIPYYEFPGQALAIELYKEAGIRGCDIGSYMLGNDPDTGRQLEAELEFTRLAIPRRVYTQAHMDVIASALISIRDRAGDIKGYKVVREPKILRHFTAELEPLG